METIRVLDYFFNNKIWSSIEQRNSISKEFQVPIMARKRVISFRKQDSDKNSKLQRSNKKTPQQTSLSIKILFIFCFISLITLLLLFISYKNGMLQNPSSPDSYKELHGTDLNYKQVLSMAERSDFDTSHRNFNSTILAYVTPWNSKGYDMAIKFRSKLTHVSPVWYQLKSVNSETQLFGGHDVDQQWIHKVRKNGYPLILPRVLLEASPMEWLTNKKQRKKALDIILNECRNQEYDGVVLEGWSQWIGYGILKNPSFRQMALDFTKELGSMMHKIQVGDKRNLQLIFVIPPPSAPVNSLDVFTSTDLRSLGNDVDGFSLMTYDYSNMYRPGPNAPISWVRACLEFLLLSSKSQNNEGSEVADKKFAEKLLMGINFYGNDYVLPNGGGPILGNDYLSLLKRYHPKLVWDEQSMEHYFGYEDKSKEHKVYFPSLQSLVSRLEEAKSWGVGLSIWEIGQGLEYFFDLL